MAYHTLLARHDDGQWGIEFGDKDLETVRFELDDYRDHGHKRKDLKIVKTRSSRMVEINAIVDKLNSRALI